MATTLIMVSIIMYVIDELLSCSSETSIILHINCISIKNDFKKYQ